MKIRDFHSELSRELPPESVQKAGLDPALPPTDYIERVAAAYLASAVSLYQPAADAECIPLDVGDGNDLWTIAERIINGNPKDKIWDPIVGAVDLAIALYFSEAEPEGGTGLKVYEPRSCYREIPDLPILPAFRPPFEITSDDPGKIIDAMVQEFTQNAGTFRLERKRVVRHLDLFVDTWFVRNRYPQQQYRLVGKAIRSIKWDGQDYRGRIEVNLKSLTPQPSLKASTTKTRKRPPTRAKSKTVDAAFVVEFVPVKVLAADGNGMVDSLTLNIISSAEAERKRKERGIPVGFTAGDGKTGKYLSPSSSGSEKWRRRD